MPLKRKNAFTFIELLIVIGIISIFAAMAVPNIHHVRTDPTQKPCINNQRVLECTIEMYNMDNTVMMDTALPGKDYEDHESILLEHRYLKNPLEPPSPDCSYGFVDFCASGTVFCKKHGSIGSQYSDKVIIPEYDIKLEKPFSQKYINFRNDVLDKQRREAKREQFYSRVKSFLFSPTFIVTILIIVTVFTSVISAKKKTKQN